MTTQYELNSEWQDINLTAGSYEISSSSGLPFEISENADKSAPVSAQSLAVKADGAKTIYARSISQNTITISNSFFGDSALAFASGSTGGGGGAVPDTALVARVNTLETNYNTLNTAALKYKETRVVADNIIDFNTQNKAGFLRWKSNNDVIGGFGRGSSSNQNLTLFCSQSQNIANAQKLQIGAFGGGVDIDANTNILNNKELNVKGHAVGAKLTELDTAKTAQAASIATLESNYTTLSTNYTTLNNNALKFNFTAIRPAGTTRIVDLDTQGNNVPQYIFQFKQQGITLHQFGRLYSANVNFIFLANPNNNAQVRNFNPRFIVRGFNGGVHLESDTSITGALNVTKNGVTMDIHQKITDLETSVRALIDENSELLQRIQTLENP